MIWDISYKIDKGFHRDNFNDNWHLRQCHPKGPNWWRVFDNVHAEKEIADLNLEGLNVFPRYSYMPAHTSLNPHIDEDEIIAVNFNLEYHPISIHMEGEPFDYECSVIDVGHVVHSVEPVDYDRLVLKFAIRAPLDEVLRRIDESPYMRTARIG